MGDPYPYSGLQHAGFAVLFGFPSLALVVVCLRAYCRITTRGWGTDDTLIVIAMAVLIAETGAGYQGMRHAYLGVHFADIPKTRDVRLAGIWNYTGQILYNPILAIVKSSVLLFMLRLGGQKKNVRLTIHGLNIFNIALGVAIFTVVIFQCTPISFFWDKTIKGGTCIAMTTFYAITAGLTILTDVLVLVVPFWIFVGLQMPRRVKIALIAVFLLGGVATVVSCFRLAWIVERTIPNRPPNPDPTYDIRFTYSYAETSLAIIAASAPAMRYLFRIWFPGIFSLSGGASSSGKVRYGNASGAPGTGPRHTIPLQDMSSRRTMIRSHSPTGSEEEIMTYEGIVRKTEINVHVDGVGRSERFNQSDAHLHH